jgi:hypothetical protein
MVALFSHFEKYAVYKMIFTKEKVAKEGTN